MSAAPAELRTRVPGGLDRARRWLERRRGLASLRSAGDPYLVAVAEAIEAGRLDRLSPAERERIDRIEELRSRLEASREEIHTIESEYTGDPADDRVTIDQVGDVCRRASHPPLWARILFGLVRRRTPERCLELGTCLGISAAYQGSALELNGAGRMISLEGARERAALASRNLAELGLARRVEVRAGRFEETLGPALGDLETVDYAFIDGHHDEEATLRYFAAIRDRAADGALFVLDDIRWSEGMMRAWAATRRDPRVSASIDLGPVGLCRLGSGPPIEVSVPVA